MRRLEESPLHPPNPAPLSQLQMERICATFSRLTVQGQASSYSQDEQTANQNDCKVQKQTCHGNIITPTSRGRNRGTERDYISGAGSHLEVSGPGFKSRHPGSRACALKSPVSSFRKASQVGRGHSCTPRSTAGPTPPCCSHVCYLLDLVVCWVCDPWSPRSGDPSRTFYASGGRGMWFPCRSGRTKGCRLLCPRWRRREGFPAQRLSTTETRAEFYW